jgi:hypothetical protein
MAAVIGKPNSTIAPATVTPSANDPNIEQFAAISHIRPLGGGGISGGW